jgi:hypothetical protein
LTATELPKPQAIEWASTVDLVKLATDRAESSTTLLTTTKRQDFIQLWPTPLLGQSVASFTKSTVAAN